MFHIILFEPEIPPNTGNIIRLCANTLCQLHLVEPMKFDLDDKRLKRAGLDYHEYATVKRYRNFQECIDQNCFLNIYALTTKGSGLYHKVSFQEGDAFLFGPESRGLPDSILDVFGREKKIRIPMAVNSRSLNLSNTVSILVYEGWRQLNFKEGK